VADGTTAPKLIKRKANVCFALIRKQLMLGGGDHHNDK